MKKLFTGGWNTRISHEHEMKERKHYSSMITVRTSMANIFDNLLPCLLSCLFDRIEQIRIEMFFIVVEHVQPTLKTIDSNTCTHPWMSFEQMSNGTMNILADDGRVTGEMSCITDG